MKIKNKKREKSFPIYMNNEVAGEKKSILIVYLLVRYQMPLQFNLIC